MLTTCILIKDYLILLKQFIDEDLLYEDYDIYLFTLVRGVNCIKDLNLKRVRL